MPQEKHSPLLWVGLAGGAVLLWMYIKKKNEAAAAATMTPAALPALQATPGNAANPTQLLPVATVQPTVTLQTAGPVVPVTPAAPNGIDPTVYQTVMEWAATAPNNPSIQKFAAAAVPSEFAGMYNLITNFWDKGIQPGSNPAYQPEVDFWNNIRAEYDPQHIYW